MEQLYFTVEKTIVLPPYPREKEKKEKRLINLGEVIAEIAKTIKERKEEGYYQ